MPVCPNGCGVNHRQGPTESNCTKFNSARDGSSNKRTGSNTLGQSKRFSAKKNVDRWQELPDTLPISYEERTMIEADDPYEREATRSRRDYFREQHGEIF